VRLELPDQTHEIIGVIGDLKALVEVQNQENFSAYLINPAVAESGLSDLDENFRAIVDSLMADFWKNLLDEANSKEIAGMRGKIVLAGLNSAPYLIRLGRWEWACNRLQQAMLHDKSPNTASQFIPLLRHILEAVRGTKDEQITAILLARALRYGGRGAEAKTILIFQITEWTKQGESMPAFVAKNDLFPLLQETGQFKEALKLTEEMRDYATRTDLGSLVQLGIEGNRLQALNRLGRSLEVLEVLRALMEQIESLPEQDKKCKIMDRRNVEEVILTAGAEAAILIGDYEQALELNSRVLNAMKAGGDTDLEQARVAARDYFPLLRLRRYIQAKEMLLACKSVFERENDIKNLGNVFCSLADLEYQLGQVNQSVELLCTALRYSYQAGTIDDISTNHHNLSICLSKIGSHEALAHYLAAGIIRHLVGSGLLASTVRNLLSYQAKFRCQPLLLRFDQLCQIVEEVEGVKFRELFYRLAGPDADGNKVMQEVLSMAQKIDLGLDRSDIA